MFARNFKQIAGVLMLGGLLTTTAFGQFRTNEPAQLSGDTPATSEGWNVLPLITIGKQDDLGADENLEHLNYRPVGILGGIGAFPGNNNNNGKKPATVRVLVNHELTGGSGYAYELANETELTGARISSFEIDIKSRKVVSAGLAYDTVYDRAGDLVTNPSQISEGAGGLIGFDRFCSSSGCRAGCNPATSRVLLRITFCIAVCLGGHSFSARKSRPQNRVSNASSVGLTFSQKRRNCMPAFKFAPFISITSLAIPSWYVTCINTTGSHAIIVIASNERAHL